MSKTNRRTTLTGSLHATSEKSLEDGFDPVKLYLQRIGAVSLLSREQDVEIAKRI